MSTPSVETFLDLLRRSGLVETEALKRFLVELKHESGGRAIADAGALAERLIQAGLLSQWQSKKLLEGRHRGFFLGKYKLIELLGTGGMSHVFLAEHVLLQRRVAVKILPKNRVQDTSYLARFHREARAAAALSHRNIVRAFDVDNDGDLHYFVMEYIEGRDLQRIVAEDGVLDYSDAVDYIRQAAEGLAHAHDAGLIHRDVKPANLLVDQNNVVKLLDLGLARFTSEEARHSLTVAFDENVLGTADYLAPEQAVDSHSVDARADIYSLGCSFYYLLAGHPPFPDGTLPQRIMAHQKKPPPSIRNQRADVSEDLVQILWKMMAKKPDDRFASAAEVAYVLERWLNEHGWPSKSGKRRRGALRLEIGTAPKPPSGGGGGSGAGKGSSKGSGKGEHVADDEPRSADVTDTTPGSNRGTVTGSGSGRATSSQGASTKRRLPEVVSIPEPGASEPPSPAAPSAAADTPGELPFVPSDSPIYGVGSKRRLTPEELEAYHARRRDQPPQWIWYMIGGGVLLALILVLAMALT